MPYGKVDICDSGAESTDVLVGMKGQRGLMRKWTYEKVPIWPYGKVDKRKMNI